VARGAGLIAVNFPQSVQRLHRGARTRSALTGVTNAVALRDSL